MLRHGRKERYGLWEGELHSRSGSIKYGKHIPQGVVTDTPVYGLDGCRRWRT